MEEKLRILAAADLHGDKDIARALSAKAKREKVDLVVLAGDVNGFTEGNGSVLDAFVKAGQKVVFVPGNWESEKEVGAMGKRAKRIDNYYVTYGGVGIAGVGGSNWRMELDENDFKKIKKNFERMKPRKRILVSHLHARKTKAEFSGIAGDEVLRRAVKESKPDLLISAHIHEAEGIEDRIGKTRVVQVGRRGTVIEI